MIKQNCNNYYQQQQQQLPLLSHGCIQQQQTKYYRKIHVGFKCKATKCPIGTVSVCLKKSLIQNTNVYLKNV